MGGKGERVTRKPWVQKHPCKRDGCGAPVKDHPLSTCAGYVPSLRSKGVLAARAAGLRRSKTRTDYKGRLWAIVSRYVRQKYADPSGFVACVTCGEVKHWKEMHAGHFVAKKAGLAVYFEERNIHPQCPRCNKWERGNLVKYAIFMVKKYGVGIVEEMDALGKSEMQIPEWRYIELIVEWKAKLAVVEASGVGVFLDGEAV
jgi:hypothetical protein